MLRAKLMEDSIAASSPLLTGGALMVLIISRVNENKGSAKIPAGLILGLSRTQHQELIVTIANTLFWDVPGDVLAAPA